MNEIHKEIETIYKDKYGQLISLLLLRFPVLPIESAEDIVQEAFADAAASWTPSTIPENPAGWIYQACKNKSINLVRRSGKEKDLSLAGTISAPAEDISEHHFKDAQLLMLMACCHPHLAPKTQVVLALKYVANLTVKNIALQLGVKLDAIEKMLYRARQKIKEDSLVLSADHAHYKKERLSIVHKVIYLLFNEGYKQAGKKPDQGKNLYEEALILNKNLFDSPLCNTETKALQALMLFNIARFATRFDMDGNVIELEYQDRSLWNSSLINMAHRFLIESEDPVFSPYHLEASIACMHCSAARFEDTNWPAICKYYEVLLKIYPSPFARINYAVSLQYTRQFEKAYGILTDLYENPYFSRSHILNSALGKYFDRMGKKEEASIYFARAEKFRAEINNEHHDT